MYAEYAKDPQYATPTFGIRRRFIPLVEFDRRQIELLHSLLFTLPGSPVLYYGDEIGMGDNIFSRRPQRRALTDAMERRSQCRLSRRS